MKVKLAACLLAVSLALPLSGCSEQEPVKLVLTTGFRHIPAGGRFLHPPGADGLSDDGAEYL